MNAIMTTRTWRPVANLLLVISLVTLAAAPTDAQRKGGGGGNRNVQTRNTTRTDFSGNRNVSVNDNRNTNVNVNRNTNVNVNRNVNVNVNNRGYYGGCCYNNGPSVAGVIAASVATAVVVGAMVASLPPSCTTIIANGITYQNCGGTYYQPQYSGGNVQYVVVVRP